MKTEVEKMMGDIKTEREVGSEDLTPRIIRGNGFNSALQYQIDLIDKTLGEIK